MATKKLPVLTPDYAKIWNNDELDAIPAESKRGAVVYFIESLKRRITEQQEIIASQQAFIDKLKNVIMQMGAPLVPSPLPRAARKNEIMETKDIAGFDPVLDQQLREAFSNAKLRLLPRIECRRATRVHRGAGLRSEDRRVWLADHPQGLRRGSEPRDAAKRCSTQA